jgi:hypothetical protein
LALLVQSCWDDNGGKNRHDGERHEQLGDAETIVIALKISKH